MLNSPVRKPSEVRGDIDPDLEAIVMNALAKDRDERTATARDLAQALHRWNVKRGAVVGMAEIADLMARACPDEIVRTNALLDEARRADPSALIQLPPLEPALESASDQPTRSPPTADRSKPTSGQAPVQTPVPVQARARRGP